MHDIACVRCGEIRLCRTEADKSARELDIAKRIAAERIKRARSGSDAVQDGEVSLSETGQLALTAESKNELELL